MLTHSLVDYTYGFSYAFFYLYHSSSFTFCDWLNFLETGKHLLSYSLKTLQSLKHLARKIL